MNRITLIGLFVLFSVCSVMGQTVQSPTNSLTIDGVTYQNPRFERITSTTVTILHSTGIATVPLAKLSPELQKQFGCDPAKIAKDNAARKEAKAKADAAMRKIARPDVSEGLTPVSHDDGKFTTVERNGVPCWLVPKQTSPNYFYMHVADGFLPQSGGAVEIELTYFDVGSGDIVLHYDSTDFRLPNAGAYKGHPSAFHRLNSGQWKVVRFHVIDARFAHRENGGADFRFYNTGDDLLISAVEVLRIEP
jgi:hypothetical protein